MEKRYGLDAISYLIDAPGGVDPPPVSEDSVDRQRQALRHSIALRQREIQALERHLGQLGGAPAEAPDHPLRRFLNRLTGTVRLAH